MSKKAMYFSFVGHLLVEELPLDTPKGNFIDKMDLSDGTEHIFEQTPKGIVLWSNEWSNYTIPYLVIEKNRPYHNTSPLTIDDIHYLSNFTR